MHIYLYLHLHLHLPNLNHRLLPFNARLPKLLLPLPPVVETTRPVTTSHSRPRNTAPTPLPDHNISVPVLPRAPTFADRNPRHTA